MSKEKLRLSNGLPSGLPFSGYTVLDLSGSVATATAGKLFADFGARVINVEPPQGHPTRRLPPHRPGVSAHSSSGLHALLSPNKESVILDLQLDLDLETDLDPGDGDWGADLQSLISLADVVLESEHPGALDARGLDFETLSHLSPGLILASITWHGQTARQ